MSAPSEIAAPQARGFDAEGRAMLREQAMRWAMTGDVMRRGEGIDRASLATIASLGLLGVAAPEEIGGSGAGDAELAIVMEAVGAGLRNEPVLSIAGLCVPLLVELGAPDLIDALINGQSTIALVHGEDGAGYDRALTTSRATPTTEGWRIDARKTVALDADSADQLLITARDEDDRIGVFRIAADYPGLARESIKLIDGRRGASIRLDGVSLPRQARIGGDAGAALDLALDRAALLVSAESIGAMQVMIGDTAAYLKQRVQFGQPLANFQVLQHRLVDMELALEETRAAVDMAIAGMTEDARTRGEGVALAKIIASRSARLVSQQAVQLHGGVGMTDELRVGHYFKRLALCAAQFGDADAWLARFETLARNDDTTKGGRP